MDYRTTGPVVSGSPGAPGGLDEISGDAEGRPFEKICEEPGHLSHSFLGRSGCEGVLLTFRFPSPDMQTVGFSAKREAPPRNVACAAAGCAGFGNGHICRRERFRVAPAVFDPGWEGGNRLGSRIGRFCVSA